MKRQTITTPALRFRGFDDPWIPVSLASIYPSIRNGFVGVATPFYVSSGIPYLQGKNIKENSIISDEMVYVSDEFHRRNKKSQLKLNDILMVQSGHVGECAVVTAEYEGSNCHALLVLTPRNKVISSFYVYFFCSPYGRRRIHKITTGNTVEHILSTDLKNFEILSPRESEQQKIAAFLMAVDKKISQLTRKKKLLLTYKKGVVQQIFDQKVSFKDDDGRTFSRWEEKQLKEYLIESRISGSSGDTARKITVKLWGRGVQGKNEKTVGSVSTKYYKRRAGQFIYSKLDFLNCAFGIIPDHLDGYESTLDLPSFDISTELNPMFLLETVMRREFYLKNGMTADGSRKARRIHADVFLDFSMEVPTISEQNKIVDFIRALDEKIALVDKQLEKIKNFKKGLLQQMFV